MNKKANIDQGNWVSKKIIYTFGIVSAIFLVLFIISLIYLNIILSILFGILLFLFILSFFYFIYAHNAFSEKGGNIQNKVYDLIFKYLDSNPASIIDIGCGSGMLTIQLAEKYPRAIVTGIDYWKGMWEYSYKKCMNNVMAAKLEDRIIFKLDSASKLPFNDGSFDLAVSNFVFHEVKDTRNKRDVVKEALRVLRKGGKFVFQDLFKSEYVYGNLDDFLKEIKSWGIQEVTFTDTSHSVFIPGLLKLPFMIGKIGIIYGVK